MTAIDWSKMVTAEAGAAARLGAEKAAAQARLVAHVSAARAALITVLPGQEMIYLAKEAEARAWVAAAEPDLADFPLLAAEIGLTAPTAGDLAALWLAMAAEWRAAAAGLEALRLSLKAAIERAETREALAAAMAALG